MKRLAKARFSDCEGEIDVLIEFQKMINGIEVKYISGLSSDDDISNDEDAKG
jgi:Holliday junction resolvase-like predicted endonuclease